MDLINELDDILNNYKPGNDFIILDKINTFIIKNIKNNYKKNLYLKHYEKLYKRHEEFDDFGYPQEDFNIKKGIFSLIISIKNFLNEENINKIDSLKIDIYPELLNHIQSLLDSKHYYEAVTEAFKFSRDTLIKLTGEEKAHQAFSKDNFKKIFGIEEPEKTEEKNYYEGIKFIHYSIQNLRNENVHKLSKEIDYNTTIHYISLASLSLYSLDLKEI